MLRLPEAIDYKCWIFQPVTEQEWGTLLGAIPAILAKLGPEAAMATSIATITQIILWLPNSVAEEFILEFQRYRSPGELN